MRTPNQELEFRPVIIGQIVVLGLGLATLLFPLYHMPDGTWIRRPLWNPLRLEITRTTDEISPADRERLMADPQQRQILESLEQLPDSFFQPKPDWLGWRTSQNRTYLQRPQFLPANWLLATTILATGVLGWYLWNQYR